MLERWHFRMLNDEMRNNAFKKAIQRKIDEGYDRVLDIGTGSGLLTLYALQNPNLKAITACEENEVMSCIAGDVFSANGCKHKIELVPKSSLDLDEGKRFSLVVTETFDSAVFGEGILKSLIHAKEKLLCDSGQIIPGHAIIYVTGFKSRVTSASTVLLNEKFCEIFQLPENILVSEDAFKTYDADDVFRLKGYDDFTFCTDTKVAMKVDLNNLNELRERLLDQKPEIVELICMEDGLIDGFVVWFDLLLDEDTKITTNPRVKSCWNQSIFSLNHRKAISKGEALTLKLFCNGIGLEIEHNLNLKVDQIPLTGNILQFLNDLDYTNELEKCSNDIEKAENVVDLSFFPFLGLLLMKQGKTTTLYCLLNTEKLVTVILESLNLPKDSVHFVEKMSDVYSNVSILFDLVIFQPIDSFGQIVSGNVAQIPHIRPKLKPNARIVPSKLELFGQIVESQWIENCNRITNAEIIKYKIDLFLENFTTDNHLDLGYFDNKPLSQAQKLCDIHLDQNLHESIKEFQIEENAKNISAILYFYGIQIFDGYEFISTNRPNSFAKRSAFITPKSIKTNDNFVVKVKTVQNHTFIKCSLE